VTSRRLKLRATTLLIAKFSQTFLNPLRQVSADHAYDKRICYPARASQHIKVAIPPQKNAKIWQNGNSQKEIGYHRRSLAKTTMFRIKTIFGDKVSARTFQGQVSQLLLRCNILNQMTQIGMPESMVVA